MTAINASDIEILRTLSDEELEELLKLYEEKYGTSSFQYLLIDTQCRWNKCLHAMAIDDNDKRWISLRKVFYTHRHGDFRRYGTYVCLHQDIVQSVSFHSWEPNFNELLECVRQTQLIHWKSGPLFTNLAPEYSTAIKDIISQKGVTIQRARSCQGSILTHADALKLNANSLPRGYKLDQLHEAQAELIHSLWANNKEGSLDYIKGLMKIDQSIGIFEKETNTLVGWIFQNEFSGLGILQVLPAVQRKGFGTILAATLSKLIAQTQHGTLSAWVVVGNEKSQNLLENVGYKKSVVHEWIQLEKA